MYQIYPHIDRSIYIQNHIRVLCKALDVYYNCLHFSSTLDGSHRNDGNGRGLSQYTCTHVLHLRLIWL